MYIQNTDGRLLRLRPSLKLPSLQLDVSFRRQPLVDLSTSISSSSAASPLPPDINFNLDCGSARRRRAPCSSPLFFQGRPLAPLTSRRVNPLLILAAIICPVPSQLCRPLSLTPRRTFRHPTTKLFASQHPRAISIVSFARQRLPRLPTTCSGRILVARTGNSASLIPFRPPEPPWRSPLHDNLEQKVRA